MHANAFSLGMKDANVVYDSEIAHDDVPWGINGVEMHTMLHTLSGAAIDSGDVVNVFKAATSKPGENLGVPGLGTLTPGIKVGEQSFRRQSSGFIPGTLGDY